MKTTLLVVIACIMPGCSGVSQNSTGQNTGIVIASPSPSSASPAEVEKIATASPTSPADERVEEPEFIGTAGNTDKKNPSIKGVAVLSQVRSATHTGYDRVVFEFAGGELPSYHIEYIDRPVHACGSGDNVPLAGDGWLEVRFTDAQAHTPEGQPTVKDRSRSPNLPIVKDLKITCDFEAEVTWVMGVASPNQYRVMELKKPTRLVVDIKHK